MGANGSGKSTLLKILAGLILPSEGRVRIDGTDLRDLGSRQEIARRIGIVFQDPETQLVEATVERELAFGMEQIGLPRADMINQIKSLLQLFDLESVRRRPPQSLSGGEKQRVAVTSILAMGPRVLLLDEPTALLDARARETLGSALDRIRSEGRVSVVVVTASPEEALRADRVVVLGGARVVADRSPRALFSEAAECEHWGLIRPPAARLTAELARRGVSMRSDVVSADEFVSAWMEVPPS